MREIKFRGRCIYTNEWFYGDLIQDKYTCSIGRMIDAEIYSQSTVYKESVGQYTGLNDINGREIYEGDIIEMVGDYSKYIIEFDDCTFCLKTSKNECIENLWSGMGELTVIGNVYENPELLRGDIE